MESDGRGPSAIGITIAAAVTLVISLALLGLMRSDRVQGDSDAQLERVVGIAVTTTTNPGDFQLAGPLHASDATTIPSGLAPTLQPPVDQSTVPSTTLPGSASDDGVCRAMSSLYDSSRLIFAGEIDSGSLELYAAGMHQIERAVVQDTPPGLEAIRPKLLQLLDDAIGILEGGNADPAGSLQQAYSLLTNGSDPAVATMLSHLRATCPDLARTLEVGLT